jgi:hypothetical protein
METVILTIEMNDASAAYDLETPIDIPVSELINASAKLFNLDIETQEDLDEWEMRMRSPRSPDQTSILELDQILAEAGVRDGFWLVLREMRPSPGLVHRKTEDVSSLQRSDNLPPDSGPIAGWRPLDNVNHAPDDESGEATEEQKFVWRRID